VASKESKIIRKAQALSELTRLSTLLAEQLNIDVPETQVTSKDAELAEIQRLESVNALLVNALEATKPIAETGETSDEPKKSVRSLKHGAK
jgi:hypothetical protein